MDIDKIKKKVKNKKERIQEYKNFNPTAVGKLSPGKYLVSCFNCRKEFVVKQYNSKRLPKICPTCREKGSECPICNSKMPFTRIYCDNCINTAKKTELWEHKLQGSKIKGNNNPAKRPEVREKISNNVDKSYKNNPNLVELRRDAIANTNNSFGKKEKYGGYRSKF